MKSPEKQPKLCFPVSVLPFFVPVLPNLRGARRQQSRVRYKWYSGMETDLSNYIFVCLFKTYTDPYILKHKKQRKQTEFLTFLGKFLSSSGGSSCWCVTANCIELQQQSPFGCTPWPNLGPWPNTLQEQQPALQRPELEYLKRKDENVLILVIFYCHTKQHNGCGCHTPAQPGVEHQLSTSTAFSWFDQPSKCLFKLFILCCAQHKILLQISLYQLT